MFLHPCEKGVLCFYSCKGAQAAARRAAAHLGSDARPLTSCRAAAISVASAGPPISPLETAAMADEELTPAQKLALATNFVINSPPAQVANVMEGARAATSSARARGRLS